MGASHVKTDKLAAKVEGLACAGVPHARIAKHIGIDYATLVHHYDHELNNSLEEKIALLGSNLYADALEGDKQSREFWLKCRARWAPAKAKEEADAQEKTNSLLEKIIDKL